ncbi:ribosome recycling factor [Candidatus Uhrbacteria bacterium]|nr:ribosome recycling factor [Candidatus Uhrbacteria bacterium]
MPTDLLRPFRPEFDATIDFLKQDLSTLRTGRANPGMVEHVSVEAYGSRMELVGVASISVPDARTLVIEPWDKSVLKDVERGLIDANLGVNPVVSGNTIRIVMPPPTEESRRNLVKMMNEKLENARIGVRGAREKAKAVIVEAEKNKEISEDEKYRYLEELDKMAAGFNERIKLIGTEKEKEIMTI